MNGEHLDMALRAAYDELSEAARDFQDTADWLSKLADSEFTEADHKRFLKWHKSLATQWEYMRGKSAGIEKLEAAVPDDLNR